MESKADIFMTVDAGVLWQATDRNIFSKIDSSILEDNIPSYLRDPDGQWFGLSKRARTIVYSSDQFSDSDFSSSIMRWFSFEHPVYWARLSLPIPRN